jgi:hypothetical protein
MGGGKGSQPSGRQNCSTNQPSIANDIRYHVLAAFCWPLARINNCFDLTRHLAALLVLYSHHFALSGMSEPTFGPGNTLGFIAVAIFFRFPASFASSSNFIDFLIKRLMTRYSGWVPRPRRVREANRRLVRRSPKSDGGTSILFTVLIALRFAGAG